MTEIFGANHHDFVPGGTGEYWEGVQAVVAGQQAAIETARQARAAAAETARQEQAAAEAPVLGAMSLATGAELISTQL